MKIILIAALAKNNIIGLNGKMPWHSKAEFQHFRKTTLNSYILMGRKTFESIGKPLDNRINIVISSKEITETYNNLLIFKDIETALIYCREKECDKIYICGGSQIYKSFIDMADEMILSRFHFEINGDTSFPEFNPEEWIKNTTTGEEFDVEFYCRKKL